VTGEKCSGILLQSGVITDNGSTLHFLKARRKDSECFHHKEMLNV
jgi:hypothetical protein